MMLAVLRPTAIAGVILNDIGPVIEPQGLLRIKGHVGKLPIPRNFEEGAEILRWLFDAEFPKLAPQDWIAFAQRTWREHGGGLVPDYDLKLARTLQGANLEHLPTLWNQFDALARFHLEVRRSHPRLYRAEGMLHCLAAHAHLVRVPIEPRLHGLKDGFALPTRNPALFACCALALQHARLTGGGPIASQCLAVLFVGVAIG
jgi:hypothetical protein